MLLGHDCLGFTRLCSCGPGRRNLKGTNQGTAGTKGKRTAAPGTNRKSQARPGNQSFATAIGPTQAIKAGAFSAAATRRRAGATTIGSTEKRSAVAAPANRSADQSNPARARPLAPATADRQFAAPAADRFSPGPNSPQPNSARSGSSAAAAEYEANKVESGFKPAYEYLAIGCASKALCVFAISVPPPDKLRRTVGDQNRTITPTMNSH